MYWPKSCIPHMTKLSIIKGFILCFLKFFLVLLPALTNFFSNQNFGVSIFNFFIAIEIVFSSVKLFFIFITIYVFRYFE